MPERFPVRFHRNNPDKDRLALVALDIPDCYVRAQFNPHEVQYERAGGWNETPVRGSAPELEHTGGRARTMSLELMFDCFEITGATLDEDLETLSKMMLTPDPSGKADQRRPPIIEIVNGPLPRFRCIVESLAVKVTMFNRNMKPVRATVSVKVKEVSDAREVELKLKARKRADCLSYTRPTEEEMDEFLESIGGLE